MAIFPAPRIRLHEVLERDKPALTTLQIYEDGAQVVPTAATFELIDSTGATQIGPSVATIGGGGDLSYAILAADLPVTMPLSDSLLIKWEVTIAGVVHTFRRPAALCRSRLYPVVSDLDLQTHYADINSIRPSSLTNWSTYIDEAFIEIIHRLRSLDGNFEYLIISNQMLRSPHLNLSLALIFRDMDSSGLGEGRYFQLSELHRKEFESGLKRLRYRYDTDQDGIADQPNGMRAARAQIFTSAPPFGYRPRW